MTTTIGLVPTTTASKPRTRSSSARTTTTTTKPSLVSDATASETSHGEGSLSNHLDEEDVLFLVAGVDREQAQQQQRQDVEKLVPSLFSANSAWRESSVTIHPCNSNNNKKGELQLPASSTMVQSSSPVPVPDLLDTLELVDNEQHPPNQRRQLQYQRMERANVARGRRQGQHEDDDGVFVGSRQFRSASLDDGPVVAAADRVEDIYQHVDARSLDTNGNNPVGAINSREMALEMTSNLGVNAATSESSSRNKHSQPSHLDGADMESGTAADQGACTPDHGTVMESTITTAVASTTAITHTQQHPHQRRRRRVVSGGAPAATSTSVSSASSVSSTIAPSISSSGGTSSNQSSSASTRRGGPFSSTSSSSRPPLTTIGVSGGRGLASTPEDQGMRASLEAGMAAVRRWIRSRTTNVPTPSSASSRIHHPITTIGNHSHHQLRRQWPTTDGYPDYVSSTASMGATTTNGEEDLFVGAAISGEPNSNQLHPPTSQMLLPMEVLTEEEERSRQRAQSEPDVNRLRDLVFPTMRQQQQQSSSASSTRSLSQNMRRRRRRRRAYTEEEEARHLSSSAAAALSTPAANAITSVNNHNVVDSRRQPSSNLAIPLSSTASSVLPIPISSTPTVSRSRDATTTGVNESARSNAANHDTGVRNNRDNPNAASSDNDTTMEDTERQARLRWIQINRRFQLVITIVALLFSLLLFAILICWVVLTSAYVVSFDKDCDVQLKPYFWLVTLQLLLDVFRSDIMRFAFNWDANSNQRIPCRVIVYNVAYLLYASLVLRMGIMSVFVDEETCSKTAPELFNTSVAFVSLSIAAWATIVGGYLLPFCVVAALLTYNGYHPSSSLHQDQNGGAPQPVFPAAYSTSGAPRGCVDRLPVIVMDHTFPSSDYPRECCICMEEFNSVSVVVETACGHVFHKQCCREWLRQARTCPVCRTDIPSTIEDLPEGSDISSNYGGASVGNVNDSASRIPIGPTGRPVVGLFRMLRSTQQSTQSQPQPSGGVGGSSVGPGSAGSGPTLVTRLAVPPSSHVSAVGVAGSAAPPDINSTANDNSVDIPILYGEDDNLNNLNDGDNNNSSNNNGISVALAESNMDLEQGSVGVGDVRT